MSKYFHEYYSLWLYIHAKLFEYDTRALKQYMKINYSKCGYVQWFNGKWLRLRRSYSKMEMPFYVFPHKYRGRLAYKASKRHYKIINGGIYE